MRRLQSLRRMTYTPRSLRLAFLDCRAFYSRSLKNAYIQALRPEGWIKNVLTQPSIRNAYQKLEVSTG